MATDAQIEANRRNAQKSTGPRTPEGKATSRFNALKTGIDARSEVIRGEDPDALDALAASFHAEFEPATPMEAELMDAVVHFAWLRRRLRKAEAETWEGERKRMHGITHEDFTNGEVFVHHIGAFSRMQRRIDSTERNFHRNLHELRKLQAERKAAAPAPGIGFDSHPSPTPTTASEAPAPGPRPPAPAPARIDNNSTAPIECPSATPAPPAGFADLDAA